MRRLSACGARHAGRITSENETPLFRNFFLLQIGAPLQTLFVLILVLTRQRAGYVLLVFRLCTVRSLSTVKVHRHRANYFDLSEQVGAIYFELVQQQTDF